MRGRIPTPTAILALRGSRRVALRKNEAQPTPGRPKCPPHLKEAEKAEWRRMVKLLYPLGLLTEIDGDQLALYVTAYCRWREAEHQLAESGTVIKSPSGYPVLNPFLSVSNGAMKQMSECLAKFGCSPADRSRAKVAPQAETKNPLTTFLTD